MRRMLPVPPPGWPDPEGEMINDPNRPRTLAEHWERLGEAIYQLWKACKDEARLAVDQIVARLFRR